MLAIGDFVLLEDEGLVVGSVVARSPRFNVIGMIMMEKDDRRGIKPGCCTRLHLFNQADIYFNLLIPENDMDKY